MTASYLPGFEPPSTHDYWTPTPDGVIRKKGMLPARARVWLWLIKRSRSGQWVRLTNSDIGEALGLDVSTVNRCMMELRREHPPGLDHPYVQTRGPTSKREILVLYRGKEALGSPAGARSGAPCKSARRSTHATCKSARSPHPKPNGEKVVAASPLMFEPKTERNDNDFIVVSGGETSPAHAREPDPPAPAADASPPARRPFRRQVDVMAWLQAAQERLAGDEVQSPDPPPAAPSTPELEAAREMSAPAPAARAYSAGLPPAKAGSRSRVPILVAALYRSGADPAAVADLVRHVGWLYGSSGKAETTACWTRGFTEAVAWLEPSELIALVEAAGSSRVDPAKRCHYVSRALADRLLRAKQSCPQRSPPAGRKGGPLPGVGLATHPDSGPHTTAARPRP